MPKRLIALLIVLLSSYAFAKKDDNAVYEITAEPHEGYEVKDNVIYYRQGSAGVIFELAQDATIRKYYADRGAAWLANPFLQSPDLATATVFLVSLVNRTNSVLSFTPGYVVMKMGDMTSFPMDFSLLLTAMQDYRSDVHKILDRSIYSSPVDVHPGEVVSKFLFYPHLPSKNASFRIEVDNLYFQNKEARVTFYYSMHKKKP
ncbi:MAG TPA: hypothetical protein VLR94_06705 [Acidobacteriota bacterium]|nr:hypothetical protein [Acidobacteriota bacterium]